MPFKRKTTIKKPLSGQKKRSKGFWRVFPGTLTVECAVVLPLFLFAMVSFLYVNEIIRCSDIVCSRLHQNARSMAVYAYAAGKAGMTDVGEGAGRLAGAVISTAAAGSDVNAALSREKADGVSTSFLRSKVLENDLIDLVATEEIKLPCHVAGMGSIKVMDRARVHAFTGFDPTGQPGRDPGEDEEIVYITPTGTVYHRSRNCPHLNVTAKAVDGAAMEKKRNRSGGKYYECEYCRKKGGQGVYYVTDYGDRYHTNVNCQGLKRDIMAVPISQAGRPPCKTCCK